ncbi:PHD finger protein 10-like [Mya arenaria]|uniref:PHD finger protein 10-like n=1 Tax=Mya arenaria TaxID=6604 RepID=UPI0022E1392E|nr:PHD finger protein 10-like [Mya arenaria]
MEGGDSNQLPEVCPDDKKAGIGGEGKVVSKQTTDTVEAMECAERESTSRENSKQDENSKAKDAKEEVAEQEDGKSTQPAAGHGKVVFGLNTQDLEAGESNVSDQSKDNYVSEFHKFLQAENKAHNQDTESEVSGNKQVTCNLGPAIEESSDSNWYKINNDKTNKQNTVTMLPDDSSNMSLPENVSFMGSNMESCASFQENNSNVDECSNLSMPATPKFAGHQPVFDESANMNAPSNSGFARPDTPNSDRDKNGSETTPQKKYRRGTLQIAAEDASEHGHGLTAGDIFEYQWPQQPDADFFMLQEQISIFLDVTSFKRKYPDLFRRVCDKEEKDFLRDHGVVSETQSDLGLTALKADEVHELLGRDYPAKYKEFLKVLQEREKQRLADKMKEFHALKLEKDKMAEYMRKARKSVSDWNRNLLKQRNEERRAFFDMHTFTFQYPKGKFRKLDSSQTEVGAYPLSVIPGQFSDYYKQYKMDELKYLPLNTAICNPPKKRDPNQEADSEGESSSGSEADSSSDSSSSSEDSEQEEAPASNVTRGKIKKEKSSSRELSKEKSEEPVIKKETECRICKEEPPSKWKTEEDIIECSECKSKGHPSCLDLTEEMVKVVKTYPWQCMECKTCVQCMDPYDEDKMLFCDKCDRGYHTFCVGLKSLPSGQWDCFSCRGDTTPIKPLPKPAPKAKRGRKPRDPNTPRRPPGRPPKDKTKLLQQTQAAMAAQEVADRSRASFDQNDTSMMSMDSNLGEEDTRDTVKPEDMDTDTQDK